MFTQIVKSAANAAPDLTGQQGQVVLFMQNGGINGMGKTYRQSPHWDEAEQDRPRAGRKQRNSHEEVFKCRHCKRFVCPAEHGTHHRNHCPFCLFSRHVDDHIGDRMSSCGASMEPVGHFQRPNDEYMLVHRCLACGLERFNRIAADDDFELVVSLPLLPPRTSRDMKAQRLLDEVGEDAEMHQIA